MPDSALIPNAVPEASQEELRAFFKGCTGFPCANFSVAGEVGSAGELFSRILFNPPTLGRWLEPWGHGALSVECGSWRSTAGKCTAKTVRRVWPFAELTLTDPHLPSDLTITAWAPVLAGSVAATSLPVLAAEFHFSATAERPLILEMSIRPRTPIRVTPGLQREPALHLADYGAFGIGWQGLTEIDEVHSVTNPDGEIVSRITCSGGGVRHLMLCLMLWDDQGRTAADVASLPELFRYVILKRRELRSSTLGFPALLPATGEADIDEYMRWYLMPAMILTRVLKDGTTLTMGYSELNQRDSFWSSWVHLYYWPDAERTMIEESARAIGPNGKLPICILPTIDRHDEVDANEYFLLRVARFAAVHGDLEWVGRIWPQCCQAMDYLVSRCDPGSHLPSATSFWADWLDIPFMQSRRYGPHFCLLYLACLKEIAALARRLGEDAKALQWEARYPAAYEQANRSTGAGGLWNGRYYVNVWRDGRSDATLLEDQMIAGIWKVIPPERLDSIRDALTAGNERLWGVRCLFPYYDKMGYANGDYANGAVMPWINFADACARGINGHTDDCLRLLRAVGYGDLVRFGDYLPHENLHGETGENTHAVIQGWNAAFLGAVLWGLQAVPAGRTSMPPPGDDRKRADRVSA